MDADYLIVGQGIAGTLLSRSLLKEGCTVMVIDDNDASAAGRIAGGIVNPVTGKRLVRSWMADELLPFAWNTYREFGEELQTFLVQRSAILDFHATQPGREIFMEKIQEENEYLSGREDVREWAPYFRFNYGVGEIRQCLLVDIRTMLHSWRKRLKERGALTEEKFSFDDCKILKNSIAYKDTTAKKIIFCEGAAGADNPYFRLLPWSKDKGEALIASIPGLPRGHIYKQGISIVPWGQDLFWIGAAHDWKFTDLHPSATFRKKVEEQLDYWLKIPYTITGHLAAQRPANLERKPFAGLHPAHQTIGILNGMGGKGCSMAPYFAHQLAQHLVYGTPIMAEADVNRFRKVLTREN